MGMEDTTLGKNTNNTTKDTGVNSIPQGGQSAEAQAVVDEIMKKYDRESNVRPWKGVYDKVIKGLLAAFSLFMIYMNLFAVWDERIRRPLFVGIVILFIFILYPSGKNHLMKKLYMHKIINVLGSNGKAE